MAFNKIKFAVVSLFFTLIALDVVYCKRTSKSVDDLLTMYDENLNASLILTKSDDELLTEWVVDHQVQQVDVTAKYRLQMREHEDHSFKGDHLDSKWNQCVDIYTVDIKKPENIYYEEEASCLKKSNEEGKDKKHQIQQLEREIKNWRKSYKYLLNLCEKEHSNDERGVKTCLVEYMERDHYNYTLQRLMHLKVRAMRDYYYELCSAVVNLEECLRVALAAYLDRVRAVMLSLYKCYNGKKKLL